MPPYPIPVGSGALTAYGAIQPKPFLVHFSSPYLPSRIEHHLTEVDWEGDWQLLEGSTRKRSFILMPRCRDRTPGGLLNAVANSDCSSKNYAGGKIGRAHV